MNHGEETLLNHRQGVSHPSKGGKMILNHRQGTP